MKNFLLTQSTEYDCGPVTLVNAMRFLFEREEIPPALIRAIWLYANDTYNEQGQKGTRGTSKACIRFLGHWFTEYGTLTMSRSWSMTWRGMERQPFMISPAL